MKNAQYLFIIVLCYVAMTGKAQNNRFTPPIMGWSSLEYLSYNHQ